MTGSVWSRFWRHLFTSGRALSRALPEADFALIEQAIAGVERSHSGEICFAVEAGLDARAVLRGLSAHERALEVYSRLRIWDTEHNNGVLIYLLLADHAVEIIADRAAARLATQAEWDAVCAAMRPAFAENRFREGVIAAVAAIAGLLARQTLGQSTPPSGLNQPTNQLPNIAVLR